MIFHNEHKIWRQRVCDGLYFCWIGSSGCYRPFCGTFLTFFRLYEKCNPLNGFYETSSVYQFTHDSIFLGEDGPTHQSIEHLASLRSIPNLTVIRPADATEVKGAWKVALDQRSLQLLLF